LGRIFHTKSGWLVAPNEDGGGKNTFETVFPVSQVQPAPVGGVSVPVNKLSIVAPYLALVELIATVSAVTVIRKRY
jgi:hypothetical protein